jgi:uncharacterized repeat protein (TIGR03803 family)
VFAINANGTSYTNIHTFAGGGGDGAGPRGSLVLSGTALYGTTQGGGAHGRGVVFRLKTDDGTYTNLHSFAGGGGDGSYPYGSLTLSGPVLYGTTSTGGASDKGAVFRVSVADGTYTNLHEFAGGNSDGATPYGSLVLSGSTLYGMTSAGGTNNSGVVFKLNIDGSSYGNLHTFGAIASDGGAPLDSLLLSGSTLYGLTQIGGTVSGQGEVFQINTDGTGYTNLHSFSGFPSDGSHPRGSLALANSTLYGMASGGGMSNSGTIFALNATPGALRIINIARATNDIQLTWLTTAGKTNYVQAGGDANGGYTNNFNDISAGIVVPGFGPVTTNYSDMGAVTNAKGRYYRIRLPP